MGVIMAKKTYTSSEIYEILESEITTISLLPGTYISEIEISKRFGVSRTPIRDVFKKLEYNNLIKVIPQKGTVINPINLSKIAEYMFGREAVELAIVSDVMNSITTYQIAKLELILISQLKSIEDTKLDLAEKTHLFAKLDSDFHKELFKLSDKEMLWDLFSVKTPDYQRFRVVVAEYSDDDSLMALYNQHKDILKCIQEKDMEKVRGIYKKHIYNGMDFITDILRQKESYFVI